MLDALIEQLYASPGVAHKADIASAVRALGVAGADAAIPVGDDCAAIPDGDGYLLFAIEGFINAFVERDPWFAGWCGLMVNLSDIAAMGGRAIAVVDAVWSRDEARMRPVLEGLAAASQTYGVPVVGGHSNARNDREQLSVAVLGRAKSLLTSFDARPGDVLVCAIDLRGEYRAPYPHWNAATRSDPARLRADLDLLPQLAERRECRVAKDISQAGVLGTLLMLMECSGVGAVVTPERVPRPAGVDPLHWLIRTFPSYGFLLAVSPARVDAVRQRFAARGIACAAIGICDDSQTLRLREGTRLLTAWDLRARPLLGCGPAAQAIPEPAHA